MGFEREWMLDYASFWRSIKVAVENSTDMVSLENHWQNVE
jgi:hypothetical protein